MHGIVGVDLQGLEGHCQVHRGLVLSKDATCTLVQRKTIQHSLIVLVLARDVTKVSPSTAKLKAQRDSEENLSTAAKETVVA